MEKRQKQTRWQRHIDFVKKMSSRRQCKSTIYF